MQKPSISVAIMYQPCSPLKYAVRPAVFWCWLNNLLVCCVVLISSTLFVAVAFLGGGEGSYS